MRFSARKLLILSAALPMICSCDKHHLGELPEVQREKTAEQSVEATPASAVAETPSAKPTPADFFPAKP
jgi:hypothetical protein